jgi:hypothetical protein
MPTAPRPVENQHRLVFAHDVAAPADALFPLLCPVREYDWIDGWSCRLVHTASGLVEPGCVFVTERPEPEGTATWVTTVHDPAARRVEFVRVTPGRRVVIMALHVEPLGPSRCRWHFEFRVTGLDAAGVAEVRVAAATGEPYATVAARLALLAGRHLAARAADPGGAAVR